MRIIALVLLIALSSVAQPTNGDVPAGKFKQFWLQELPRDVTNMVTLADRVGYYGLSLRMQVAFRAVNADGDNGVWFFGSDSDDAWWFATWFWYRASEEIRGIDYWNGTIYGLGNSSHLKLLDSTTEEALPSSASTVSQAHPITRLEATETIRGIDYSNGTVTPAETAASLAGKPAAGASGAIAAVQTPGAPALTITRLGNSVIVSWPLTSGEFRLQQSSDLTIPEGWVDYFGAVSTNDGGESVNVTPPGNLFFRLYRP